MENKANLIDNIDPKETSLDINGVSEQQSVPTFDTLANSTKTTNTQDSAKRNLGTKDGKSQVIRCNDIEKIELDNTLSALVNADKLADEYQVPNIIIKSLFNLNFNKKKPYQNYGVVSGHGTIKDEEDDVSKFLLKLETQIFEFVLKSEQDSMKLSPMNSYYRLLSHQLAEYYRLGHILSNDGTSMVFYKINTSLINADDETKKHAKFDQSGNIKPLDFKDLKFDPREKLNRVKLAEIYKEYHEFFDNHQDSLVNDFDNLQLRPNPMMVPDYYHYNLRMKQRPRNSSFHNEENDEDDDDESEAQIIINEAESEESQQQSRKVKQKGTRMVYGSNENYVYQPYGYYDGQQVQQKIYPGAVPMIALPGAQIGAPTPYYYYPTMLPDYNRDHIPPNPVDTARDGIRSMPNQGIDAGLHSPGSSQRPGEMDMRNAAYTYQYYPIPGPPGPPGHMGIPYVYYGNGGGYYNRGGKRYGNRRGKGTRNGDGSVETSSKG